MSPGTRRCGSLGLTVMRIIHGCGCGFVRGLTGGCCVGLRHWNDWLVGRSGVDEASGSEMEDTEPRPNGGSRFSAGTHGPAVGCAWGFLVLGTYPSRASVRRHENSSLGKKLERAFNQAIYMHENTCITSPKNSCADASQPDYRRVPTNKPDVRQAYFQTPVPNPRIQSQSKLNSQS